MSFIFYVTMITYTLKPFVFKAPAAENTRQPTARELHVERVKVLSLKWPRTQKATRRQRKRKAVMTARRVGGPVKDFNRFFVKKTRGIFIRDFCYMDYIPL